ncbi:DUF6402 family protein [Pantoea sp. S61]|uniref:DUF6402 family protein n=1 Tax=Pantoea sp. S61 TaxID=2767442 RepID=UPI00351C8900
MDKMNWHTAAKLMRHWFSISPAFEFTEKIKRDLLNESPELIDSQRINVDIVKMSWASSYKRVQEGIEKLRMTWNSSRGRGELKEKLAKIGDYKKTVHKDWLC